MTLLPESIMGSPGFEKIYNIPAIYYKTWLEKWGGSFVGKKVLDFGCGEGLVTAGLSLFCGSESVVGVDIGDDFVACPAKLKLVEPTLVVPSNISFIKVEPAQPLGISEYDIVVSWSVLEHVSQDVFDVQMKVIYDALKPGGYCVFQIAPLFFSPNGSHLFGIHKPWAHLTSQVDLLRKSVYEHCSDKALAENMWGCYLTLNKFTASTFVSRISFSGLRVLDVYETYVTDTPAPDLLEIFSMESLTKEQILIVCQKVVV